MSQGSNASKGGKGSGIVGFQRVTIGKNHIPSADTSSGLLASENSVVALNTTPYSYAAYVKLLNSKELPQPEEPEGLSMEEWELADRLLSFDIDPADLDPKVTTEILMEAVELIEEARDNYTHSPSHPSSSSHDPSTTQGLAMTAYESLGYDSRTVYDKTVNVFMNVPWEGPRHYEWEDEWS